MALAGLGMVLAVSAIGLGLTSSLGPSAGPVSTGAAAPALESGAQPGGRITLGGRRYSLGTADDQIVHAVWGCAGPDVPVLVRPDGAVFRFESLAETGHDTSGLASGHLPAGVAVHLVRDDEGCLELQAGSGSRAVTLTIPSAPTTSTSP